MPSHHEKEVEKAQEPELWLSCQMPSAVKSQAWLLTGKLSSGSEQIWFNKMKIFW